MLEICTIKLHNENHTEIPCFKYVKSFMWASSIVSLGVGLDTLEMVRISHGGLEVF